MCSIPEKTRYCFSFLIEMSSVRLPHTHIVFAIWATIFTPLFPFDRILRYPTPA